MRRRRQWTLVMAMFLGVASSGRAHAYFPDTVVSWVLHFWAPPSAAAGRMLVEKYGLPDDATPRSLTWTHKGPWKRTVVWNRKQVYRSLNDLNILSQTIDYPVPEDRVADVLSFRPWVVIDRETGELSSLADREELNFLTVNLADEIVRGKKTPEQAKVAYTRIVSEEASGKTSPYLTRLLFR